MRILSLFFLICFFYVEIICDDKVNLEQAIKDLGSENYDTRLKAKKFLANASLRAIPLLRKAAKSEDLEIKDFAEKKISESISYVKDEYKIENMLDAEPNLVSTHKYLNEYYDYLKNVILASYEKNSLRDPKWDDSLKKLILLWVEYHRCYDMDNELTDAYHFGKGFRKNEMEARMLINELSANGCNDAMFVFLRNSLYYAWSDYRFSMDELAKAADDLVKIKYSYYFKYFSSIRIKILKAKTVKDNELEPFVLDVFKQWLELGKEDIFKSKIGQRRLVLWLTNFIDDLPITELESNLEKIGENIGKDSWADHLIKANFFIKKGWSHRGSGFANEVTDEGWKSFRACLKEAAIHAKASALINPDYPEPYLIMIKVAMSDPDKTRIRLWFEKAFKAEANNAKVYADYNWALNPRWGGSVNEMLSLGREYLLINNPKVNTAKFYISALNNVINEGGEVFNIPGIIEEVEWAVEQQVASKSIYSFLYNNDLALAAFYTHDYAKALKAIQETKGLFSSGWVTEKHSGTYIERFVNVVEKYKTTKTGVALKSLMIKEDVPKNIKIIIDNFKNEIDPIDQSKVVNLLMTLKNENPLFLDNDLMDLLYSFGYRETSLVAYMKTFSSENSFKLKPKLIERYGAKTIEALDETLKFPYAIPDARKELAEKIKTVFMKDIKDEKELETNDEYNKAQIRGFIYIGNMKNEKVKYKEYWEAFTLLINKIKNIGDGGDFLSAQLSGIDNRNINSSFGDTIKNYFYSPNHYSYAPIGKEIKRLEAFEDNQKLWEEIQKVWIKFGSPTMVFEMINLLQQRKLNVEAEILKNWLFHCMEAYNDKVKTEYIMQFLGVFPGYNKEAFQMGIRPARSGSCQAMNLLIGYHAFKLGQYHMAYEFITKSQNLVDHEGALILNRRKYSTEDELLQYIVGEMLATKELPEYIRYNLKDQFDVKFKK